MNRTLTINPLDRLSVHQIVDLGISLQANFATITDDTGAITYDRSGDLKTWKHLIEYISCHTELHGWYSLHGHSTYGDMATAMIEEQLSK